MACDEVRLGLVESRSLSISGDRDLKQLTATLLFVWPTMSICKKNLKSGVVQTAYVDSGD